MHYQNCRWSDAVRCLAFIAARRPGISAAGLLAGLLCLPVFADTENTAEDTTSSGDEPLQLIPIQVPDRQVDEIMEERREAPTSPAEEEYPEVPGCEPLAGDRGALPLADRVHRAISRFVCAPAERVEKEVADEESDSGTGSGADRDNSDGNEAETGADSENTEPAPDRRTGTTLLRLSSTLDWRQGDGVQPGVGLSANVRLTRLRQRINRAAERGTEAVQVDAVIPDQEPEPVWYLSPILFLMEHTDVGLRGLDPFIRMRTPTRHTWDNGIALRSRPMIFWRLNDGAGVGGALQMTYPHDQDNQWRFNNQVELSQASASAGNGIGWSQQLSYRHYLADRFILTGRVNHAGRSEPDWQTDLVRSDFRLRRSIGRPWLSGELEPYVLWERGTGFEPTPGLILRLAIEFGDYDLYED